MNISRLQSDKLIVGTNDVSYSAPDTSPSGSAILNGPVLIGKPSAAKPMIGDIIGDSVSNIAFGDPW